MGPEHKLLVHVSLIIDPSTGRNVSAVRGRSNYS